MTESLKEVRREAVWVTSPLPSEYSELASEFVARMNYAHWSRVFEYPWAVKNGNFTEGQWVLDAAGGDGPLQHYLAEKGCEVVNVDLNPNPYGAQEIRCIQGDLRSLPFPDGCFPRITCISVLEHTVSPVGIVEELWRVLSPGGRLLVSIDVASYSRWNHTIDMDEAGKILRCFGLKVPPLMQGARKTAMIQLPELDPKGTDPKTVDLFCLCFYADKDK